jgi:hypothetical protein
MFPLTLQSLCRFSFVCGALSLLFVSPATAQLQTESFNVGVPLQNLSSSGNFTLPDFDETLGTLDGVSLTFAVNNSATIQVYNTLSSPVNFTNASLTVLDSITGPGNLTLSDSLASELASGTAQAGLNTYSPVTAMNSASGNVDSSFFNLWEGQANNIVDLSYVEGSATYKGTDLGQSLYFGGTATGQGNVSVVYSFTGSSLAAPEPPTKYFALLVAGALVVLLVRRKTMASDL